MGYSKKHYKSMKSFSIFISFALLLSTSCNNKKQNDSLALSPENSRIVLFRDYLKKFKIIQLPFYYKGWADDTLDISKLATLDNHSSDTLFFNIIDNNIKCYGILSDTTKYFDMIYFKIGDAPVPILATYSKMGKLLDNQELLCYGCGSDCGLKYCSYTAQINTRLKIYIADTLIYCGMCDTSQNIIPNTDSTFINYKVGEIGMNGKIKIGEIKKMSKKGSP
jgi:hypothetical protein